MTSEHQKLISDNDNFYKFYFARYNIKDPDLQQQMMLNLCANIDKFDPSRGSYTTFVSRIFKSTSYVEACKHQAKGRYMNDLGISLDSSATDEEDAPVEEIIGFNDEGLDDLECKMVMNSIIDTLEHHDGVSKNSLKIYLNWIKTNSFTESGEQLGLSKQHVNMVVKKIQKVLKENPDINWRLI